MRRPLEIAHVVIALGAWSCAAASLAPFVEATSVLWHPMAIWTGAAAGWTYTFQRWWKWRNNPEALSPERRLAFERSPWSGMIVWTSVLAAATCTLLAHEPPAISSFAPWLFIAAALSAGYAVLPRPGGEGLRGVPGLKLPVIAMTWGWATVVLPQAGAGADPEVGAQSAVENLDQISDMLSVNTKMIFITAGMGGGTGTGAAPIVAQIARELGILTVAVVTKPFPFEGRKRMAIAQEGITMLKERVDSLIIVPNEKLLQVLGKDMTVIEAFKQANGVLDGAVQGITDLILLDGLINVDFADVRTVISEMGMAMMGTGQASGADRAGMAAEAAIRCPLLEDVDLQGARGILVNITSGYDLTLGEFEQVGDTIRQFADEDATIIVGSVFNPDISDQLRVTVVATGLTPPVAKTGPTKVIQGGATVPPVSKDGTPDYGSLDLPASVRSAGGQRRSSVAVAPDLASAPDLDHDFLDVPAFLRRQAD